MGACLGSNEGTNEIVQKPAGSSDKPQVQDLGAPGIWSIYTFDEIVGSGASASVARAVFKETNTVHALKIITQEKHKKQFYREIDMVGPLDHPSIVRFINAYKSHEGRFIASEFCDGGPLIQRIANRTNYGEAIAAKTFKTMCQSIKYLHDQDIVHRDLKPENFVYAHKDHDAGLKLLDFGIAMKLSKEDEPYKYRAGTPYYMSPEVIKNEAPRTSEQCKKADMWALGVCLFILLNGQSPFKGTEKQRLFDNICYQKRIKFKVKGISKQAKALVFRLLNREVNDRADIDEVLNHPWVLQDGKDDETYEKDLFNSMKMFSAEQSVHRRLQEVGRNAMDPSDVARMKQVFDSFDLDKDEKLNRAECARVLESFGYYKQKAVEVAEQMIKRTDENKDDHINFTEFQSAVSRFWLTNDEFKIHAVFSALDTNKDGHLELNELLHVVASANDNEMMSTKELNRVKEKVRGMFNDADIDGDGKLQFNEFVRVMKGGLAVSQEWNNLIFNAKENIRFFDDEVHKSEVAETNNCHSSDTPLRQATIVEEDDEL